MPLEVSSDPVYPEAAIRFFRGKIGVTEDEWDALEDQNHDLSFKLAGIADIDVVESVYSAIDDAITNGTTLKDFKAKVIDELMNSWGGSVENPGFRLETIFRTNLQSAYQAGHYSQAQQNKEDRPYAMLDVVEDGRTCFAGETPILMGDGSTKPIGMVKPGDVVLSCRGYSRPVIATMVTPKRTWVTLRFSNGVVLRATPNHPLLSVDGWVRAGNLKVGTKVVSPTDNTEELQGLWQGVPSKVSFREVLQRRLSSSDTETVPTDLCSLREEVQPKEARSPGQVLLLEGVLGIRRDSEANPMSDLRGRVSEGGWSELLRELCSSDSRMPVVSQELQSHTPRSRERSTQDLLKGMLGCSASKGCTSREHQENLQEVQQRIQLQSRCIGPRELQPPVLLNGMQEDAYYPYLCSLWSTHHEETEGQVLLDQLLSKVSGGDWSGENSQRGIGERWDTLPARSQDQSLECGLLNRQEVGHRSRRELLALDARGETQGCQEGCPTGRARVHGDPSRRRSSDERPWLYSESLKGLWPRPIEDLGSRAPTATVVSINWELNQTPEPAYDIQVLEDSGFIADGVVVHNSDICADLDEEIGGRAIALDDPIWSRAWPPNHFNCRSSVITLDEQEAIAEGFLEDSPDPPDADELEVDEDFDHAPGDTLAGLPDPEVYPEELQDDVERFL